MKFLSSIILLTVFIVSCGGGGGSSNDDVITPPIPPTTTETLEHISSYYSWGLFCEFTHDGLNREFTVYIPQSYEEGTQVPLLFNFHGYGSSAYAQIGYGDFRDLSEQHNFIIVIPQGSLLQGTSHWNVKGWTSASTTDDIDFTSEMIDRISAEYSIDLTRVYATGMSNGGFMSYHLACNLSSRIAAIASVTGSMTPGTYNDCNPLHPTSIMQIHGINDSVVPYQGNAGMKPIPEVIEYWKNYNQCTSLAIGDFTSGSTSESHQNCLNDVSVELWVLNNFGHSWPETRRGDEINGAEVIWNFLSLYSTNGRIAD